MALISMSAFKRTITGNGLIHPLQRLGSSDFVSTDGESLVRSSVLQILGTRQGELPWRPEFGLNIEPYRHVTMTTAKEMQLAQEVADTILRFETRVRIISCYAKTNGNVAYVKLTWSLRSDKGTLNVALPPVTQEVVI